MTRVMVGPLVVTVYMTLLPGPPATMAQQGLVRSQTKAVEGAVRNQLQEGAQPYLMQHRRVDRRDDSHVPGRRQQSWYLPIPPRTAVK
jgi:hypothetical protein